VGYDAFGRRVFLQAALSALLLSSSAAIGAASATPSGALTPQDLRKLKAILGSASKSFDVSSSPMPTTAADLASFVLDSLENPANEEAVAIGQQAGSLLSAINFRDRDVPPPENASKAPPPPFDKDEKARLLRMYNEMGIPSADHRAEIARAVSLITSPKARAEYDAASAKKNVPWYVIAALHYREATANFFGHLHNGDRLDLLTTHVPKHRPRGLWPKSVGKKGPWPPTPLIPLSAWIDSAGDALDHFRGLTSWTIERMLYEFEAYNGFGYRPHGVPTPYVWSYSQYYTKGGYDSDGHWKPGYVSKQCGLAPLVQALAKALPKDVVLTYEP
jgi:lysozyme family protein